MRTHDSGIDQIRRNLAEVASRISAGRIGAAEWRGADVVISASEPEPREPGFYPDPRSVVTPNAAELSWLFFELKNAFDPVYDYQMKFEFFGRLANAALRYEAQAEKDSGSRDLLLAVLHEAFAIADEMEEGSFGSLAIAIGNEIIDDHIANDDRRGFVSIDATRRFFAEKGIEL